MYSVKLASPDDLAEVLRIDDDATTLYASAGMPIELSPDHPFTVDERARWLRVAFSSAAHEGRLFLALDEHGAALGFAALDRVDAAPYLDQLSVRASAMRRGVGRFLLGRAIAWAAEQGAEFLWLTTYGHLPWNRAWYEREGFSVVPEGECGPGIRHHIDMQRRYLPRPEERVAMRRRL